MKEGKFLAKVIACGLKEGKAAPQAWMQFQTDEGAITWYGSTSDKAVEYTVKALLTAGFQGTDFGDLEKGLEAFMPKEVKLSVKEEEYNGKTNLKVKGVFSVTESQPFAGQAPKMAAVFAAQRQEMGLKSDQGLGF